MKANRAVVRVPDRVERRSTDDRAAQLDPAGPVGIDGGCDCTNDLGTDERDASPTPSDRPAVVLGPFSELEVPELGHGERVEVPISVVRVHGCRPAAGRPHDRRPGEVEVPGRRRVLTRPRDLDSIDPVRAQDDGVPPVACVSCDHRLAQGAAALIAAIRDRVGGARDLERLGRRSRREQQPEGCNRGDQRSPHLHGASLAQARRGVNQREC